MSARGTGTVCSFDDIRGTGLLITKEGEKAFFHYSSIESDEKHRTIRPNTKVKYVLYPKHRENSDLLVKSLKEVR